MMQMQMGMANMGAGGPQGFDASAAFKNEREQLQICRQQENLCKAEKDLLGLRYPFQESVEGLDFSKFSQQNKQKQ